MQLARLLLQNMSARFTCWRLSTPGSLQWLLTNGITKVHLFKWKTDAWNESDLGVKCNLCRQDLAVCRLLCACESERQKGAASENRGLIKRAGFIWSEQFVQEPLLSYASNWDSSSDAEPGGALMKLSNLCSAHSGLRHGLLVATRIHLLKRLTINT